MNKCSRTGKSKFKSKKRADNAKMYIWSHDPQADLLDLHSYLCEYCGNWHVGHKSYYENLENKNENPEPRPNTNTK